MFTINNPDDGTPIKEMSASQPCWICGDPADSDEHKHKRSDLVARYGRSWTPEQQPFVIRGDGSSRWTRIQGPNDRKNLYEKLLCRPCNNARTKPFDLAYERFSGWVLSETPTLCDKAEIDFADVFGSGYASSVMALLCYFAKNLGCRIVDAGYNPSVELSRILRATAITDTIPLRITFGINEFWRRVDPTGRIIGNGDVISWLPDLDQFHWSQNLGYLEIYYWLNAVYDPFPFGGDPISGAVRAVRLGRHDPLPGEPAMAVAAKPASDFP
jgi:hypothetical protein